MDKLIATCIEDMRSAAEASKISLAAQVRAYDLVQSLSEAAEMGILPSESVSKEFCSAYEEFASALEIAYDEAALRDELSALLEPLEKTVTEARFESASIAALHEFAKEVFEIWQNGGIFMRRRALNELRARAGFRLESHRIGNYVAKTFDLMNEAQVRFAGAQQALFAADIRYKICPGTYAKLYQILGRFIEL